MHKTLINKLIACDNALNPAKYAKK